MNDFRALLEATGTAILVYDGSSCLFVNKAYEALFGYTREDLADGGPALAVHPECRELIRQRIAGRLSGEDVPARYQTRALTKQGVEKWVDVNASAVVWEGKPASIATFVDITEQVRLTEALRESEGKLRFIIEHSNNLFYSHTPDHVLTYLSPQTRKFFDCEPEEALVRWTEFMTDNPGNKTGLERTQAAIDTGEAQPPYQLELVGRAGRKVWVEVSENPVVEGGKTVAVVGALRDITREKQMEEQLLHAQRMEALGRMAGGIAHDFSNLLTAIIGSAQMLQRDDAPPAKDSFEITTIERAAKRGAELIRALLAFARRQVLQPVELNIDDLVAESLPILRRVISENIEIVHRPCHDLHLTRADRTQIVQILMNLCVNARDAMPEGGSIQIETSNLRTDGRYVSANPWASVGRFVNLTVRDNGCGIDPAVLPHIFEPFYTTKPETKGSGLGLATVYGIVSQHGGFVHAESHAGVGTTISIFLPAANGIASAVQTKEATNADEHGDETILLVEDEEQVRSTLAQSLTGLGYTIIEASNGLEALDALRREGARIDLVLTDMVMPGMGGRELLSEARAVSPGMPFLFTSGYSDTSTADEAQSNGAPVLCISKPFGTDLLARTVREALRARSGSDRREK